MRGQVLCEMNLPFGPRFGFGPFHGRHGLFGPPGFTFGRSCHPGGFGHGPHPGRLEDAHRPCCEGRSPDKERGRGCHGSPGMFEHYGRRCGIEGFKSHGGSHHGHRSSPPPCCEPEPFGYPGHGPCPPPPGAPKHNDGPHGHRPYGHGPHGHEPHGHGSHRHGPHGRGHGPYGHGPHGHGHGPSCEPHCCLLGPPKNNEDTHSPGPHGHHVHHGYSTAPPPYFEFRDGPKSSNCTQKDGPPEELENRECCRRACGRGGSPRGRGGSPRRRGNCSRDPKGHGSYCRCRSKTRFSPCRRDRCCRRDSGPYDASDKEQNTTNECVTRDNGAEDSEEREENQGTAILVQNIVVDGNPRSDSV